MTWIESRVDRLVAELKKKLDLHEVESESTRTVVRDELHLHMRRHNVLEGEANQAYTESILWSNEVVRLRTMLCLVADWVERQPEISIPDAVKTALDALFPADLRADGQQREPGTDGGGA